MDRPDPDLRGFLVDAMRQAVPDRATESRVLEGILAGITGGAPLPRGEEAPEAADLVGEAVTPVSAGSSVTIVLKTLALAGAIVGAGLGVRALRDDPSPTSVTSADAAPLAAPSPPPAGSPTSAAPTAISPASAHAPTVPEPPRPTLSRRETAPDEPRPDDFLVEVRLVGDAQKALEQGDPARALELARTHAEDHPHGQLALEREVIEAIARCRQGDRTAGARFLIDHPRTTQAEKVRVQCAGERTGAP